MPQSGKNPTLLCRKKDRQRDRNAIHYVKLINKNNVYYSFLNDKKTYGAFWMFFT